MASKTERTVVNVAGLVRGIVLVTFPAASAIFTKKPAAWHQGRPWCGPTTGRRSGPGKVSSFAGDGAVAR
jgi:hypothetical protein